jgi:hypothetical protein
MKKLYFLFICLFIQAAIIAQSYSLVFDNRFNGLPNSQTEVVQSKTDDKGNTYVIGNAYYLYGFGKHMFVTKISKDGVKRWTKHFSENGDSADAAEALAIDAAGNVYVTGIRYYSFQDCDDVEGCHTYLRPYMIIIKYNAAGKRIWINRFSLFDYEPVPVDIAVSKKGHVIITANATRSSHYEEQDFYENSVLIQTINAVGETTGSVIKDAVLADAACLDNEENILVAGAFVEFGVGNPNEYRTALLKFTQDRIFKWSATYSDDKVSGELHYVACDTLNNIYVHGRADTFRTSYAIINPRNITIKYNASGEEQWVKLKQSRFSGPFIVDEKGNTWSTQYLDNSHISVMKFNSSGKKQWITSLDSFSISSMVKKQGIIYALGYSEKNSKRQVLTFNSTGKQKMITTNNNFYLSKIFLDEKNNIYLSGGTEFSEHKIAVAKYSLTSDNNSISNIRTEELNMLLYPNPSTGIINITFNSFTSTKNYKLLITDVSGNVMLSKSLNNTNKIVNATINVQQLNPGTYSATVTDGVHTISKIFLKQ